MHENPQEINHQLTSADIDTVMKMALRIEIVRGLLILIGLCAIGTYLKPDVMSPFLKELSGFMLLVVVFLFPPRD